MTIKTYALFDVIGVKKAFASGKAGELLEAFWQAADAWANGIADGLGPLRVLGENATQSPDAFVTTYSDSALLTTGTEFEIDDFWKLVKSLKTKIDDAAGPSYVIVNREEHIDHHDRPALGFNLTRGDGRARYMNAGGSGPAFANLFPADEAVKRLAKKGEWSSYSVYVVGSRALPTDAKPKASGKFIGLDGEADVHALQ